MNIKVITMQVTPETLYHRDDALLYAGRSDYVGSGSEIKKKKKKKYIAYVILIWVPPIPADRWHSSLWP